MVLESLSLGTPVITMSHLKGLNEFKKQVSNKNLLFCKDMQHVQNLLTKLKARKDFKRPLIRTNIIENYNTPKQYSKKVSGFIKKIIDENSRN